SAVAVQADGKIVVAGATQVTINGVKKTAFTAVRLNPDGSLDDGSAKDTTQGDRFGVGGKFARIVDQGGGEGALAIAIQKDGKIILAGTSTTSVTGLAPTQLSFLRVNRDGTFDRGYGTQGVFSTSFATGVNSTLRAIALQPDGKLLAVGAEQGDWLIMRLTS